ncbi:hypothetical protein HON52_01215 [Candidatus Uhrbacteria bacterium]|nr:hypothetical protein [Candidatus Uhrbacteria bacterium]
MNGSSNEDSSMSGKIVIGYVLNPYMLGFHAKGKVVRPKIKDDAVLKLFQVIKPGEVVDEATYNKIRMGLNPDSANPGMVLVRGGPTLPVFVPKHEERSAKNSDDKVGSIVEFVEMLNTRQTVNFGGWNENGEKQCALHANSPNGQACLCGGYGDPTRMKCVQIGTRKFLAIDEKCFAALRAQGIDVMNGHFSDYVNVRPARQHATPTPTPNSRDHGDIPSTIEAFADHD